MKYILILLALVVTSYLIAGHVHNVAKEFSAYEILVDTYSDIAEAREIDTRPYQNYRMKMFIAKHEDGTVWVYSYTPKWKPTDSVKITKHKIFSIPPP